MANGRHLSVGSVIEKNKIASEEVYLILIEVECKNEEGVIVQTLNFVKNSENIVYRDIPYQAANFDLDISVENNQEPSISLSAHDESRTIMQYMEAYGGLVGSNVKMTVVNSANLDSNIPEIEESFKITSSSNNKYIVEFQLGTESAVNKRYPNYRQFKDRCSWAYKGPRCKYAGPLNKCDLTLLGPNGCLAHDNIANFGGNPGLNES